MSLSSRAFTSALLATSACGFSGDAKPVDGGVDPTGDGMPVGDAAGGPWLAGYSHRRAITIIGASIEVDPSGPHLDFPVMIALGAGELGMIARADRADLAFTRTDATTRLDHEIELAAGDAAIAWVRLPELAATADTTIFLYYGNATPPPHDPHLAWSSAYRAVYHLNQDPDQPTPGAILDATTSGLHGTAESSLDAGDLVDARAGRGLQFDGSDGCVSLPSIDLGPVFTISVWSRMDNVAGIRTLLSNSQDQANRDGFRFFLNSNGQNNRRVMFETGNGTSGDPAIAPDGSFAHDVFAHVAAVVDRGAGIAWIYVDGKHVNGGDLSIRNDFNTASTLELGRMKTNNEYAGILDQLEIATVARSPAWLRTTTVNQGTPAAFYAIGDVELRP